VHVVHHISPRLKSKISISFFVPIRYAVSRIENVVTVRESNYVPAQDIIISDCGELNIFDIET
jgi:hypothetical protein